MSILEKGGLYELYLNEKEEGENGKKKLPLICFHLQGINAA